ncbi:flocculation protein FLO11-like [Nymphaea colorata]|nr:flocculation protein FLO11-like [Nymphaea colorata]
MNRSFRAPDSKMPPSLHQRPGMKLGSVMKEKEEELALFLEMRKREKERQNLLIHNAEELDPSLGSRPGSSPVFKIATATAPRKIGSDDFLNSDGDKNDYDWLLTPPGTPLFPSLEKESHGSVTGQLGTPKVRSTALKSRLSVPQPESAPRSNTMSRQPISSSALSTSSSGLRRPSSSASTSSTASRPSTPTGRSALQAASKATRPSTPTSRSTLPSTKPISSSARPSTPAARSSTPTARPILPSKTSSRPSTPTRRPSTPSALSSNSGPPGRSSSVTRNQGTAGRSSLVTSNSGPAGLSSPMTSSSGPPGRSSSVSKSRSTTSKIPGPPRGASPTVRSRPWQPSEMPGFSLDAPPNLRTKVSERPVSASRGRPGAPNSLRSGLAEANSIGIPRRQSCSPSRGRAPNTSSQHGGTLTSTSSRLHPNAGDSVSPVVIGNKMVERVVNVRRLAPPRQDDLRSSQNNPLGKSSPDSTGFGRSLSKKSLDMALRHMDIRRSIPGGLRPLVTNVPASSLYSVRSGPARSRPVSISDSPLATSSNASSEQSVNNNICLDTSEMDDDDLGSERGVRSTPTSQPGSIHGVTNWLHSPEIKENHD